MPSAQSPLYFFFYLFEIRDLLYVFIFMICIYGLNERRTLSLGIICWYMCDLVICSDTYHNIAEYVPYTNSLLQNILFIWHPPLLYTYLLYLIRTHGALCWYYDQTPLPSLHKVYGVLCGTLGFSMWWALQEGTWGGWWGWDMSEYLLLMWGVGLYIYIHSRTLFVKRYIYIYLYLFTFIYIYITAQLFLFNTAHTFLQWHHILHYYCIYYVGWYVFCFIGAGSLYYYYQYTLFFITTRVSVMYIYNLYVGFFILVYMQLLNVVITLHHVWWIWILLLRYIYYSRAAASWTFIHLYCLYIYLNEQLLSCVAHTSELLTYSNINLVYTNINALLFTYFFIYFW